MTSKREAPVKGFLANFPAPPLAETSTPVTVAVVSQDVRPQYSPGLLPGALFIPIIPYFQGGYQGVPLENCLTFAGGSWKHRSEVCGDYALLFPLIMADGLRRSGAVKLASFVQNPERLKQYELVLQLELRDFSYHEGYFSYCFPVYLLGSFVFWSLGLPYGRTAASADLGWKLYSQADHKVLAAGNVSYRTSRLVGFYYGGGYANSIADLHRELLPRLRDIILRQVIRTLASKDRSFWDALIQKHLAWRRGA